MKREAPSVDQDPRFVPVARALARTPGFSLMESRSGGTRGMMLNGKSFGMSTHHRFILKLNETAAAALIADGICKPFSAGRGRAMKGWVEVTGAGADWVALAREALRIAAAAGPARREAPARKALQAGAAGSPIDGYLAGVPGAKRTALEQLRRTIRSVVPRAEECISYRIPAFRLDGKIVAGFCARRDGCSYLPFSGSTLKTLAKELAAYDQTKSSLHFRTDEPLPAALVRKLIRARVAEGR